MLLNVRAVAGTLAALLFFLGIALLAPAFVGLVYREPAGWSFLSTSIISLLVGGVGWIRLKRAIDQVQVREGFAIVALAWFVLSLVGAIPFMTTGILPSLTDAFFETMSGFTTTGATVLGGPGTPDIEDLPNALLFWRSLTHWLGGMGIIVLALAVLPILGVGGMQLFRAEVPGPSADKLTPRVRETAKRLWLIYVSLTAVQTLMLATPMGLFDAINHAFSTMATGGFSTRSASVGAYDSAYVDWVVIVFMFLAGTSFALHYRLFMERRAGVLLATEFRVYLAISVVAAILVTIGIWDWTAQRVALQDPTAGSLAVTAEAVRLATFQVLAIVTTTGFATADYAVWSPLAVGIIFLLFFSGGMAGSTAGGVKVMRHVLMFKNSFKEIKQLVHPQAVLPVRLDDTVVSQDVLRNVLSFLVLYIGLVGFGTGIMALIGMDLLSAFGSTMSAVGNIGPAFGTTGPAENYAHIAPAGKWVLALLMMAGRLEIFTVLILFVPAYWRR
ncbi:MAG: TrkH family potassium uptake protein [Bacteroidota bacterium]